MKKKLQKIYNYPSIIFSILLALDIFAIYLFYQASMQSLDPNKSIIHETIIMPNMLIAVSLALSSAIFSVSLLRKLEKQKH